MKYKYLIVDDEPLARKLVASHASKIEGLELAGEWGNAIEASNFLRTHNVDLIFLDIQMPEINGLQFINTLKNPPAIILTTAFRPRVILLVAYDRVPRRQVRFSRFNIYARDKNTCQYCAHQFSRSDLNIDHVIPRSRGGLSTWDNVVCSCLACNRRKGGQTPDEAGMKLLKVPRRPEWTPFMLETFSMRRYREWLPYLSTVDASYWNTELES